MSFGSDQLIAAGRRARRTRTTGALLGTGVAVVVAVAAGAVLRVGVPTRPAPPGTVHRADSSTGRRIDAALRANLPERGGLVLERLYPGDWNRTTALPSGQADRATEWHGVWRSDRGGAVQTVLVDMTFLAAPEPGPRCGPADGTDCLLGSGPYGTWLSSFVQRSGTGDGATLWAEQLRTDSFVVRVGDRVADGSGFRFSRSELTRAVTAAALTIPVPARWPARPSAAPGGAVRYRPPAVSAAQPAAEIRSRLDRAVRDGLPGGASLRVRRSPMPLELTATRLVPLSDGRSTRATRWYADWTGPGGAVLALQVAQPATGPATRAGGVALCGSADRMARSSCSVSPLDGGGWLVRTDLRSGDGAEEAVQREVAVLRVDGSRVRLTESVRVRDRPVPVLPFSAEELVSVATGAELYVPPARR